MKAFLITSLTLLSQVSFSLTESEIRTCKRDSDCLIVPYKHCCGSTKRAINKKFIKQYESNVKWQSFQNESFCENIGICPSDRNINRSKCVKGFCKLDWSQN